MNKGLMFPDDLFSIINYNKYASFVNYGATIAKDKSIIFCGICRDCGDSLERNLLRISLTSSFFYDYSCFFYENDSIDQTVETLKRCNVDFVSEKREKSNYSKSEDPYLFNRCLELSECRNVYLDFIKNQKRSWDYVCVVDMDVFGGWSYNGFLHSIAILEDKSNNAGISAYGVIGDANFKDLELVPKDKYMMYDTLVFRPLGIEPPDNNKDLSKFNNICLDVGDNPIVVDSSFGGLAIYKYDYFINSRYGCELHKKRCDADHVILHKGIKNNGGCIILNPSMVCSYSNHKYSRIKLNG